MGAGGGACGRANAGDSGSGRGCGSRSGRAPLVAVGQRGVVDAAGSTEHGGRHGAPPDLSLVNLNTHIHHNIIRGRGAVCARAPGSLAQRAGHPGSIGSTYVLDSAWHGKPIGGDVASMSIMAPYGMCCMQLQTLANIEQNYMGR